MGKVTGVCVFRNDGDGCLSSKYINNGIETPYTETCKKSSIVDNGNFFVGSYYSVWIESVSPNEYGEAILDISQNGGKYMLEWRSGSKLIYKGLGMNYDGLLVGCYWSE